MLGKSILIAAGMLCSLLVRADENGCDAGKKVLSKQYFLDCMGQGEQSRGISQSDAGPDRSLGEQKVKLAAPSVKQSARHAKQLAGKPINIELLFDFNSAELSDEAKRQLAGFGEAFSEVGKHLLVEGHTDATGAPGYNLSLSERRAQAVKDYLSQTYAVKGDKIKAVGKGVANLANPQHPDAEENRRVVFYLSE